MWTYVSTAVLFTVDGGQKGPLGKRKATAVPLEVILFFFMAKRSEERWTLSVLPSGEEEYDDDLRLRVPRSSTRMLAQTANWSPSWRAITLYSLTPTPSSSAVSVAPVTILPPPKKKTENRRGVRLWHTEKGHPARHPCHQLQRRSQGDRGAPRVVPKGWTIRVLRCPRRVPAHASCGLYGRERIRSAREGPTRVELHESLPPPWFRSAGRGGGGVCTYGCVQHVLTCV